MLNRYIFFVGTLGNGGAERVISILSNNMAEQGMDVEILTYYDRPLFYQVDPKVKITAVESCTKSGNKIKNLIWLRQYFRKNAKVVISFLAPFNMMAIASNLGNGIPIIVADRNDPTKVPTNKVLRVARDILYRFANGVVLQTQKNQEYFCQKVQKNSTIIYNPVNLGDYAGAALEYKKENIFVTAGRLLPQKNQEMMIKSFADVVKKHPEYQLVIYGEGSNREKLEQLVKELDMGEKILLPGSTKALHEKLRSAEGFLLSSDYEGMPNALIEAMCLGLPCVSTKVSGATDLIEDHENGLLTELNDQEAFTNAIIELIENPDLRVKFAKNAINLNDSLEVSKIMNQWIEFINRIIAEK